MTPRLLAQLSWVFECDAEELAGRGGKFASDAERVEADRLRRIAGELAARAEEAGQPTGLAYCFSAILFVLLAGCSGAGYIPVVGRGKLCEEVTAVWEHRAHQCGHAEWRGNYEKCDSIVALPGRDPEECFRVLNELPCDQLMPLPEACSRLFP